jgi:hypothetical protein
MKKQLSTGAVVGSLIAVAVAVAIVAAIVYKPSFGPGPAVTPQPFKPPAGYDPSKASGGPIGAPKDAGTQPQ